MQASNIVYISFSCILLPYLFATLMIFAFRGISLLSFEQSVKHLYSDISPRVNDHFDDFKIDQLNVRRFTQWRWFYYFPVTERRSIAFVVGNVIVSLVVATIIHTLTHPILCPFGPQKYFIYAV